MNIDYQTLKLVHGVDFYVDSTTTDRRLKECRNYHNAKYDSSGRAIAIHKALSRRSDDLNGTELRVLREFPERGIILNGKPHPTFRGGQRIESVFQYGSTISNALIFADGLNRFSVREHAAIVSLIRLGGLVIMTGSETVGDERHTVEIIVRANS